MSRLLSPLVPLYAAAVAVKNAAYDRGWRTTAHLDWPTISVGNLSVGGAGKTPLVIRLAQLLVAQGIHLDVLSRGYGRESSAVERVDSTGNARRYGDEPLLIARTVDIAVYVGANRHRAGLLAESEYHGIGIHLLDDGFQHRQLARDMDIVVVRSSDFGQALLPAGRLREPISALRRASVLVLRAEEGDLLEEVRRMRLDAAIWIQHRKLAVERAERVVAFCGIAQPREFFFSLRLASVELLDTAAWPDHHPYTTKDIDRLISLGKQHHAQAFLTTEKDAVRISPDQRARLEQYAPLNIARLEIRLEDEAGIAASLAQLLVRK